MTDAGKDLKWVAEGRTAPSGPGRRSAETSESTAEERNELNKIKGLLEPVRQSESPPFMTDGPTPARLRPTLFSSVGRRLRFSLHHSFQLSDVCVCFFPCPQMSRYV